MELDWTVAVVISTITITIVVVVSPLLRLRCPDRIGNRAVEQDGVAIVERAVLDVVRAVVEPAFARFAYRGEKKKGTDQKK